VHFFFQEGEIAESIGETDCIADHRPAGSSDGEGKKPDPSVDRFSGRRVKKGRGKVPTGERDP
jgi:hypothetical protein